MSEGNSAKIWQEWKGCFYRNHIASICLSHVRKRGDKEPGLTTLICPEQALNPSLFNTVAGLKHIQLKYWLPTFFFDAKKPLYLAY